MLTDIGLTEDQVSATQLVREKQVMDVLDRMTKGETVQKACREVGFSHHTVNAYLSNPLRYQEIRQMLLGAHVLTLTQLAQHAPDIAKVVAERAADPDSKMADLNRINALKLAIEAFQVINAFMPGQQPATPPAPEDPPALAQWLPPLRPAGGRSSHATASAGPEAEADSPPANRPDSTTPTSEPRDPTGQSRPESSDPSPTPPPAA